VLGTAHLAFGTSTSFGGVNQAAVHIDGMLRAPTIDLDGVPLMDKGKLKTPACRRGGQVGAQE